jgi:hypothetical protein
VTVYWGCPVSKQKDENGIKKYTVKQDKSNYKDNED